MQILVTDVAGFIGSTINLHLIDNTTAEVANVTNLPISLTSNLWQVPA